MPVHTAVSIQHILITNGHCRKSEVISVVQCNVHLSRIGVEVKYPRPEIKTIFY